MSENKYSDRFSADQLQRELNRVKKRRFPFGKSKTSLDLKNGEMPRITLTDRGLLLKEETSGRQESLQPQPEERQQTEGKPENISAESIEKNAYDSGNKNEVPAAGANNNDNVSLKAEITDLAGTSAVINKAELTDDNSSKNSEPLEKGSDAAEKNGGEQPAENDDADKKGMAALEIDPNAADGENDVKTAENTAKKDHEQADDKPEVSKKLTPWELEKLERAEKEKAFEILVGSPKKTKPAENVSADQIQEEIKRVKHKREYGRILRETVIILLGVAAAAVLVSMLFLPVLRVTGTSMEPTFYSDEIVVCSRYSEAKRGDIVAFYFNNKVLLKRVIATAGDVVNISDSGKVIINGDELNEPYAKELSLGECDLEFPVQVPENRIFVMGDNRETSVDSRSSAIGFIADEYIIGKVFFRAWPLGRIGVI